MRNGILLVVHILQDLSSYRKGKQSPYVPFQYLEQAIGNETQISWMLPDCVRGKEKLKTGTAIAPHSYLV